MKERKPRDNPRWPEQDLFCERVAFYAEEEGLVKKTGGFDWEGLGDRFDLSGNTVRLMFTSRSINRPHVDTLMRIAKVRSNRLAEKKPPARLDQVKSGILCLAYQARSLSPAGPAILMQLGHGSLRCTAKVKLGLLTTKGLR